MLVPALGAGGRLGLSYSLSATPASAKTMIDVEQFGQLFK